MVRSAGISLLAAAALCATRFSTASAQGGWRQWDIQLRDGRRIVANPLGAPDDRHLAVSVGGFTGHDSTISRSRIDYIAARLSSGATSSALPPPPPSCADIVVRLDGRRTTGRVTLRHVEYSEGVVTQRDVEIDLADVAYVRFGSPRSKQCRTKPHRSLKKHI